MKSRFDITRQFFNTAAALLLLGLMTASAQERSDYETVKAFQAKYDSIRTAIRQAMSVQDCGQISADIQQMKNEYIADTTLLNKALYPNKYDDEIDNVTIALQITQNRLGLIESQVSRIADLELQVRTLSGQVDSLSQANDKLMASLDVATKALEKNRETMASMQKIIDRLRAGIRARDEAIFAMADSMFVQYGQNLQNLPEQQKQMLVKKIERHNVVSAIRQAAEQNLEFLEKTQLTGKDLVQMIGEQHKFKSYWNGVGPKLSSVYLNGRGRGKQVEAIDTIIARWGRKADSSLWAGLYKEFTQNSVPVDSFSNSQEFVSSLSNYFDSDGGNKSATTSEKAKKLSHFLETVWNPSVSSEWMPMLVSQGIVTKDQQMQLQTKLAAWESAASPSHALTYIIIVIIVIALLVFFYVAWKRKKPQQAPDTGGSNFQ